MREKIEQYFADHRELLLSSLQGLIAINSVKGEATPQHPFGEGPADALQYTLQLAEKLGLHTANHENYVGTIELNELPAKLGILTHVDIVDIGSNWSKDPFGGEIENGKMYGRGATDDKGPTIAALFALAAAKSIGVKLNANARLIVGTDEESGCNDTKYYFKKQSPPPYVFSPDGEFPVINIEKGGLRTSFGARFEGEEAPLPRVVSLNGGYRVNVVPPQAECVLEGLAKADIEPVLQEVASATGAALTVTEQEDGTLLLQVEGKGAHASLPHMGINAITVLLMALNKLPLADSKLTRALNGVSAVFPHGDYYAEHAGLAMEDELSGKLTMNLAILRFDGVELYGFIDSRVPICATEQNTMHVLADALAGYGVELKRAGFSEAHHTPADSPFVQTLLQAYEKYSGNEGYCQAVGGGTYVHGIPGGVAFGCTMPGVDARVHGADEFVIIDDLITSAKIFTEVIIAMCGEQQ